MEATGIPGKIQVSESTAEILISSGKGHWVTRRIDAVHAKGKGPYLDTLRLCPWLDRRLNL